MSCSLLLFKSFMHLYGTMSLEILKVVCGIWYLAGERSASNPSNHLQFL
ncbi:hypothetical protein Goari_021950 [Gossypium aridum]|uniref:Uncharacterized protein n=1 Tax=Gossypium aridum TaxID=34290 RepID=A0A7J8YS22_GOSAI|nr:hypothetical protein [Gossypium aridum]